MKIISFETSDGMAAGFVDGDSAVICASGAAARSSVQSLIDGGPAAVEKWRADGGPRVPLSKVRLLAPIPEPRRDIFCVGKNYHAHAAEFHSSGFDSSAQETVPSHPVIFTKPTTSVCGPNDIVRASLDPTGAVDYEGELGVVIGSRCFGVSKDRAYDHVFGYVIVNDVTSRELQKRHNQWIIGRCQRRRKNQPRGGAKPGQCLDGERPGSGALQIAGGCRGALAHRARLAVCDQVSGAAFRARLCARR